MSGLFISVKLHDEKTFEVVEAVICPNFLDTLELGQVAFYAGEEPFGCTLIEDNRDLSHLPKGAPFRGKSM